jgi:hypothetical protein
VIVAAAPPRRALLGVEAVGAREARALLGHAQGALARVTVQGSDARGHDIIGQSEPACRARANRCPGRQDDRAAPRQHHGGREDSLLGRKRTVVGDQHRLGDQRPRADCRRRVHAVDPPAAAVPSSVPSSR